MTVAVTWSNEPTKYEISNTHCFTLFIWSRGTIYGGLGHLENVIRGSDYFPTATQWSWTTTLISTLELLHISTIFYRLIINPIRKHHRSWCVNRQRVTVECCPLVHRNLTNSKIKTSEFLRYLYVQHIETMMKSLVKDNLKYIRYVFWK